MRQTDISNGEDVGVSLFVQGCHFHCKNCFNQDTWDFNGGKEWNDDTKNKFLELMDKPYIKRISILGGEPLANENVKDVYELLYEIRERYPNKKIWLYTGYEYEQIFKYQFMSILSIVYDMIRHADSMNENVKYDRYRRKAVKLCDILVDGRFDESKKDLRLKWRGSSNQRVIDIEKTYFKNSITLYTN